MPIRSNLRLPLKLRLKSTIGQTRRFYMTLLSASNSSASTSSTASSAASRMYDRPLSTMAAVKSFISGKFSSINNAASASSKNSLSPLSTGSNTSPLSTSVAQKRSASESEADISGPQYAFTAAASTTTITTTISSHGSHSQHSGNSDDSDEKRKSLRMEHHESTIVSTSPLSPLRRKHIFDLVLGVSYLPKSSIMKGHFDSTDPPIVHSSGLLRPDCGEDAFYITSTPRFSCFGVADGVGGWNALGVNPALFAWELMECCQESSISHADPMPWSILEEAYERVKSEGNVTAGSSTACLLSFDKNTAILHSANLGDSGYLVLRLNENRQFEKSASADANGASDCESTTSSNSSSDPATKVKYQSKALQHYFNAPYQLAILPDTISQLQRANYMNDHPSVAFRNSQGPLESGDILVVATDGLFDNMFVEDIIETVQAEIYEFYRELLKQDPDVDMFCGDVKHQLQERVQNAANEIVSRAAYKSVSETQSPFAREAKINGWGEMMGGKVDDVTVITGIVVSRELEHPLALL